MFFAISLVASLSMTQAPTCRTARSRVENVVASKDRNVPALPVCGGETVIRPTDSTACGHSQLTAAATPYRDRHV